MKGKKEMNELQRQAVEQAAAATASKTMYTGGTASAAGWLLSNEFIAIGGFALAILGFAANLYFKIKEDKRQQRAHEAHMQEIKGRRDHLADAVSREVDQRLSRVKTDAYGGMFGPIPKRSNPADDQGQDK
jgi:hypothetical protein